VSCDGLEEAHGFGLGAKIAHRHFEIEILVGIIRGHVGVLVPEIRFRFYGALTGVLAIVEENPHTETLYFLIVVSRHVVIEQVFYGRALPDGDVAAIRGRRLKIQQYVGMMHEAVCLSLRHKEAVRREENRCC
jgi:hypothetical protein